MNENIDAIFLFIKENLAIIDIIVGVVVFIIMLLFRNKLSKGILNLISKLIIRKDERKREPFKTSFLRPLSVYFLLIGIFTLLYLNIGHRATVVRGFKICTILIICWALVNYLSNNLFLLIHFGDDADDKINTTAIRFINNILKILIISFAVVMVIGELGYNINGLITGIGVGGLAVSLAAQDAVSNLISGFIIVLEKPFIVGDFIQTKSIQGTVAEVTMRSTKIRTLEDTLVTLPNNILTSDAIINISRLTKRLINLDYSLTYSTPNELMIKCQDEIKSFLIEDENILPAPLRVEFDRMEDSSLNINVFCYTKITDIHEFQGELSRINYGIKSIIENNGAEFAFPSTSVYIEKSK